MSNCGDDCRAEELVPTPDGRGVHGVRYSANSGENGTLSVAVTKSRMRPATATSRIPIAETRLSFGSRLRYRRRKEIQPVVVTAIFPAIGWLVRGVWSFSRRALLVRSEASSCEAVF
jgi:hypothetical protein